MASCSEGYNLFHKSFSAQYLSDQCRMLAEMLDQLADNPEAIESRTYSGKLELLDAACQVFKVVWGLESVNKSPRDKLYYQVEEYLYILGRVLGEKGGEDE